MNSQSRLKKRWCLALRVEESLSHYKVLGKPKFAKLRRNIIRRYAETRLNPDFYGKIVICG